MTSTFKVKLSAKDEPIRLKTIGPKLKQQLKSINFKPATEGGTLSKVVKLTRTIKTVTPR